MTHNANQWTDAGLFRVFDAVKSESRKPPTADQCACRQAERDNLLSELTAALTDLVGWFPTGPGVWHTDAPIKAVERARAVLARARSQQ